MWLPPTGLPPISTAPTATAVAAWYVMMFSRVERLVQVREAEETKDDAISEQG